MPLLFPPIQARFKRIDNNDNGQYSKVTTWRKNANEYTNEFS